MNPIYGGSPTPCTSLSEDQLDDHLREKAYEQSPSSSSFPASSSTPAKDDETDDVSDSSGAVFRWMPSKMRIMRKMMNSAAIDDSRRWIRDVKDDHANREVTPGTIRVCSDCNTTKTPLWRSGPRGPKSLCNACGIRQRKARRAMAAAGFIPATEQTRGRKEKIAKSDCNVPFKKRCKFTAVQPRKNLSFEEVAMSLGNSSAFHGVFPQDEKDAAVLLMSLSCGLILS
ncbi:protein CYTOKININ-RESPONSIVE GATA TRANSCRIPTION FACTOR 1-like [Wolffia australiana]